jgi:hypothetical protein
MAGSDAVGDGRSANTSGACRRTHWQSEAVCGEPPDFAKTIHPHKLLSTPSPISPSPDGLLSPLTEYSISPNTNCSFLSLQQSLMIPCRSQGLNHHFLTS